MCVKRDSLILCPPNIYHAKSPFRDVTSELFRTHINTYINTYTKCARTQTNRFVSPNISCYGVATISRLLKIIGLLSKRAL